ncbi:TetR/AcrR family transcriptional regulator [Pseudonocardia eucalypti]|uniref:TetR/AcrR family transcriptional regulator n=1 Tax=Pseudonocardia eucalypti TaxID=648755 RepID=A0ABP9PPC6_9PSEU|nr:AcrR family transcriptional regulator [Pseudonocardia eucalypti]
MTDGRTGTADRIAEVALRLFTPHGYAGVSMEQVRRQAGVSNGSLYHHFRSRAELVAHLFLGGITEAQELTLRTLSQAPDAEAGVRGVVAAQLNWVEQHPELARLVYSDPHDEVLLAAEPAFGAHNRRYVEIVSGWLDTHMRRDTLTRRPFAVAHALWAGPTQEFCRHWLHGRSPLAPHEAAGDLGEGAWAALTAPGTKRGME